MRLDACFLTVCDIVIDGFMKGISQFFYAFALEVDKPVYALYFPEMLKASRECRFTPCTHTHEPGCAVKAAVEEGKISCERYSSYLGMLEEGKKYR